MKPHVWRLYPFVTQFLVGARESSDTALSKTDRQGYTIDCSNIWISKPEVKSMKVSQTEFRPSVHTIAKYIIAITGGNTKDIDTSVRPIFSRNFKSSDRVVFDFHNNFHPYDICWSSSTTMDQFDAASVAVDLQTVKTKCFSNCLIGLLFPIGEERTSCKIFKILLGGWDRNPSPVESVTITFNPYEAGQSHKNLFILDRGLILLATMKNFMFLT